MSNTITQTITEYTTIPTNVTRMVLRPQTLFLREQFQNQLENQINNSTTNRLPYLNSILLLILEIIHTTSYTHNQILQSEIVKRRPDLCNTKLLKELAETISYFNKKK